MSSRYQLSDRELDDLEFEHRHTADKRDADRVKTVYLLGKGRSVTKIAEALMIDRETVRNHFKRYRKGGLPALQETRCRRQRRHTEKPLPYSSKPVMNSLGRRSALTKN